MCTGLTIDVICVNTKVAMSLANTLHTACGESQKKISEHK